MRYLEECATVGVAVAIPEMAGMRGTHHVFEQEAIDAVDAALAAERPLLVRGEPGVGKSQLARAVAHVLERRFCWAAVDARTEARDLLYAFDPVARLAHAQLLRASGRNAAAIVRDALDERRFVTPGPLWWGFDWAHAARQRADTREAQHSGGERNEPADAPNGVVVLLDEVDKADASVPNGLLAALGDRAFDAPRTRVAMQAPPPLVLLTTNETRALPEAFLRRCLVLHLSLPADRRELITRLVERGKAHFGAACANDVLEEAADQLAGDRERARDRSLSPPGLAEYIDVLRVLVRRTSHLKGKPRAKRQRELLERIKRFAFDKHPPERRR